MRTLEDWLSEYGASHQNRANQRIHKVCVPLILWSVVGFFSLVRWPAFSDSPFVSLGSLLCLAVLVFYFLLGTGPFVQMLLILGACLGLCSALEAGSARAGLVYGAVFVLAWIGQFVGHVLEGKRPSFFKDLQFLLIGPLWVFRRH